MTYFGSNSTAEKGHSHLTYGPITRKRTKRLLEALLTYANDEVLLPDSLRSKICYNWKTENLLVIETTIRALQGLIHCDKYQGQLSSDQIKKSLKLLEKFLKVLSDNRSQPRGSDKWHFSICFWYSRHKIADNLKQFDLEWEKLQPDKSKQVTRNQFDLLEEISAINQSKRNELDAKTDHLIADQNNSYNLKVDWGDAVDTSNFLGRQSELALLTNWIKEDNCRLISLLGMGGIGKTSLAAKLAQINQDYFQCLYWRSLRNALPFNDLLQNLISFLSKQQVSSLPESNDDRISLVISYLRKNRSLLILDNIESVLQSGQLGGRYLKGYEGYGHLLRRLADESHQSCVLLTSRERPKSLSMREGKNSPVRSLELSGISLKVGKALLNAKGLQDVEYESVELVNYYSGNPLALNIVAATIKTIFLGRIPKLINHIANFGDIRDLLEHQFNRLSQVEKYLMYWLAINREPVTLLSLRDDLLASHHQQTLIEALESLKGRSLIEVTIEGYTLQPVLMEFLTHKFIQQICNEIQIYSNDIDSKIQQLHLLRTHALVKAQAKEYVQEAQVHLILRPLIDELITLLGSKPNVASCLSRLLSLTRGKSLEEMGYVGGNIVNLFRHLQVDLSDHNFSHLSVWQADMRGINLYGVNFTGSDLSKSVFSQTLGSVHSIAFSPDDQMIAAGDVNGKIRLFDSENGQHLRTITGHTSWVQSIVFSPTGNLIASGSPDQTIMIWDVEKGENLKLLTGHTNVVYSINFSPDGQQLVSGSDDGTVRLWNSQSGQCHKIFKYSHGARSTAFSPDGQNLAIGYADGTIRIWDIKSGLCLKAWSGHEGWVWSITYSPDGQALASASDDETIKLWNVINGACTSTLVGHSNALRCIVFSPSGDYLISGGADHLIKIWDIRTTQCLKTLFGHTNWVWSVAINSTQRTIASGSEDGSIKIWDIKSGMCLHTLLGYTQATWAALFARLPINHFESSKTVHQENQYIISGGEDKLLRIWSLRSKQCVTLAGHTDAIRAIAFSPLEQVIASGSSTNDKTIRLWDVQTGQCKHILSGHDKGIWSLAFHPKGKILASCGSDQTVKLWDTQKGVCLTTFQGHNHWIWSVAFSPKEEILATGSFDCSIKLWNIQSEKCLNTLNGHSSCVSSVAFCPNGTILASGSFDHTAILWDLNTNQYIHKLEGHSHPIWDMDFSPDGQLLATASVDHTVRLWKVDTGQCLRILEGHTNAIFSASFSFDGQLLVTSSQDETIKIWNVSMGKCIATLRPTKPYAGMNITETTGLTDAQKETLLALGGICRS
ncbi:WD40 domain-containing protein [Acaryochloris marina]|uniref:WD-repeat protein n=1 Tax=Acaryochloris marina (strain MBIC 11017) TaxID=329726 RepID=A8ZLJ9_ACAM1|nr:NB-ARC domain-containing protein [Acaryochloris marina]ABW32026.1 WD-repeat protein [Acaryochloris marina MBIC11017]BDM83164.1 hypothetical protein AM10699_60250 [Acaryochloris marina MBIC10699]